MIDRETPDLVTEWLVLHPLGLVEAARVTARDPSPGSRWAPGYPDSGDVAGARRYLAVCAASGDPQPFGAYEVRRRADGVAIGGAGFHGRPNADGAVTIGYGLVPAARGRGYATEALGALLALARARGVSAVLGDADVDNVASQRVMLAAGTVSTGADERVRYYRISWDPEPDGRG